MDERITVKPSQERSFWCNCQDPPIYMGWSGCQVEDYTATESFRCHRCHRVVEVITTIEIDDSDRHIVQPPDFQDKFEKFGKLFIDSDKT